MTCVQPGLCATGQKRTVFRSMGFINGIIGALTRERPSKNFQPWHGLILLAVLIIAAVLGIVQRTGEPRVEPEPEIPIIINEETCQVAGGTWNACGSACRTAPDMPCIQLCVEYCECISDDQCPFGAHCKDIIDGIGVCSSDSLSPELSF